MRILGVAIATWFWIAAVGAQASTSPIATPHALCETAIVTAEYVERIPARLLAAIAEQETGRFDPATGTIRPWPWSINAEGAGQYFAAKHEAVAAVRALQAQGVRSIDVGCMQINLLHHPDAFLNLEEAFDPRRNALYAARFLNALYTNHKDWPLAIGAYHSETPALGGAYRALVMARWQRPDFLRSVPASAAYNAFPDTKTVYGAFASSGSAYGNAPPRLPGTAPKR